MNSKPDYVTGVHELEEGDRVTVSLGYSERDGTVLETFHDQQGYGIRLEMDRGDYKTVGPEHVESIH